MDRHVSSESAITGRINSASTTPLTTLFRRGAKAVLTADYRYGSKSVIPAGTPFTVYGRGEDQYGSYCAVKIEKFRGFRTNFRSRAPTLANFSLREEAQCEAMDVSNVAPEYQFVSGRKTKSKFGGKFYLTLNGSLDYIRKKYMNQPSILKQLRYYPDVYTEVVPSDAWMYNASLLIMRDKKSQLVKKFLHDIVATERITYLKLMECGIDTAGIAHFVNSLECPKTHYEFFTGTFRDYALVISTDPDTACLLTLRF